MEYVAVLFMVQRQGKYFISKCLELETSSFGSSEAEAIHNLFDATEVYLKTLEDLGEIHQVLREKKVSIYSYEPAIIEIKRMKLPIDSRIHPKALRLG